jgi:predicted nucleotidyltransferase
LRQQAEAEGVSLNEYCVRRLDTPAASAGAADEFIGDAIEMFGAALVGVVEYGSLMRDEAGPESDADFLLVLDRSQMITRDLYRQWDALSHSVAGRRVDAHFTHIPNQPTRGGIWAEAAVDGRVLFERDLAVSRALVAIRRDIADGRLKRRTVHGQSYWTAA